MDKKVVKDRGDANYITFTAFVFKSNYQGRQSVVSFFECYMETNGNYKARRLQDISY